MSNADTSKDAVDRHHRIYIDRGMVFQEGVTWTTVAGLYPHAYVPAESYDALRAQQDALVAAAHEAAAKAVDVLTAANGDVQLRLPGTSDAITLPDISETIRALTPSTAREVYQAAIVAAEQAGYERGLLDVREPAQSCHQQDLATADLQQPPTQADGGTP